MLLDPKKDFKDLKYDVFGVESNVLDSVKGLDHYKPLVHEDRRDDLDKIIRYVMVLYDKKSPLVKMVTNIGERKKESALISGYDLKTDEKILARLYDWTDVEFERIALQFLKDQNDMYWSMIVSNEQTFWEFQRALNAPIDNYKDDKQKMDALNVKSKIMEECNTITERVETYYYKVFGDGEAATKAKQSRGYSPEAMANRRRDV